LVDVVAQLKAELSKAQELANQHQLEAESKEKRPAPALADCPQFFAR
jgi:hypothetical protein